MSKKELTIEEYAALVGELNNKIAAQEAATKADAATIKTLNSDVQKQAVQISTLTGEKSTLQTKVDGLTKENETATGIINELKGQVNDAAAKVDSADISNGLIAHKGKKYPLQVKRFNHNGVVYEAQDIIGKTDLIQELIDEKTGVFGEPVK